MLHGFDRLNRWMLSKSLSPAPRPLGCRTSQSFRRTPAKPMRTHAGDEFVDGVAPSTNAAVFAKQLGNEVHLGEQGVLHRLMRKPYKKRMRMPSMLDRTSPTSSAGSRANLA